MAKKINKKIEEVVNETPVIVEEKKPVVESVEEEKVLSPEPEVAQEKRDGSKFGIDTGNYELDTLILQ